MQAESRSTQAVDRTEDQGFMRNVVGIGAKAIASTFGAGTRTPWTASLRNRSFCGGASACPDRKNSCNYLGDGTGNLMPMYAKSPHHQFTATGALGSLEPSTHTRPAPCGAEREVDWLLTSHHRLDLQQ